MTKRIIKTGFKLLLALSLAGMLTLCHKPASQVTTLRVHPESATLDIGQSLTLTVTVVPASTAVTWRSMDPSVAKVEDGTVTAVSEGETYIIATALNRSKACLITVPGNGLPGYRDGDYEWNN